MKDIVNQIKSYIIDKQDILLEQLNFGACDASLRTFKSKINADLPEVFYHFYETFNGSVNDAVPIWGNMIILPLSGIIYEKEILDNKQAKETSNWNPKWIPFIMENENSFICINLNDDFKIAWGEIIYFRSNSDNQPVLFKSFFDWLKAFHYLITNFKNDVIINNYAYQKYFEKEIVNLIE